MIATVTFLSSHVVARYSPLLVLTLPAVDFDMIDRRTRLTCLCQVRATPCGRKEMLMVKMSIGCTLDEAFKMGDKSPQSPFITVNQDLPLIRAELEAQMVGIHTNHSCLQR
jgi:hypothetical protein